MVGRPSVRRSRLALWQWMIASKSGAYSSHLREMNHSGAFWEVVRSVMPDYEQARGALHDDVLPVFD